MAASCKLQLNDSTNYFYDKITTLIENAKDLKDLHKFIEELLPISELQQLLLTKLSNKLEAINKTTDSVPDNNNHKVDTYLNKLYYTLYPLDDIFSDDILCSIIQFLAAPDNEYSNQCDFMYNALPVINKHFNDLMKQNPILYQQYTVCITLNNKVSNPPLNVEISHSKKTITINSNQHYHHHLIYNRTAENIKFSITKIDDMNKKCPFKCWYTIKKWKLNVMNQYAQPSTPPLIYIQSEELSPISQTPPPKLEKINAFNPDTLVYDKNVKKKPREKSLMQQLIETAKPFIKSCTIYNNNNNRLLINVNDLGHKNKNNDQLLYGDFFKSLHKLFHINCKGYQLLPFDVQNLLYLDLTVTNNNNNNNNNNLMINGTLLDELQSLNHLLVFRIDLQNVYSTHLNQSIPIVYKMMLSFPKNIEFIQIDHFEDTRQTLFNFNQCENIISLVFNNSNISGYGGYNTYHDNYNKNSYNNYSYQGNENLLKQMMNCFIWPKEENPIQCVFIQKHEQFSLIKNNANDSNQWHIFFQQSKLNNVPIKTIHYTNLPDVIDSLLIPTTISVHDNITDIQIADNITISTATKNDNTGSRVELQNDDKTENKEMEDIEKLLLDDADGNDDDDDDDDAVNITLELLDEKIDQYFDDNNTKQDFLNWIEREPVSILYPNCYQIFKQLLSENFNINTIISKLVNIYFDENVDNDPLLIALKENKDRENYLIFIGELIECIKTKYQIEIDVDKYGNKEEQKQEDDDEDDEEEKDREYKHTELTHDALDKFLMEHISIDTIKYDEDNVSNNQIISNISKRTTINTISHDEKKMDDYDVVGTDNDLVENKAVTPLPLILNLTQMIDKNNINKDNDENCVILKDSGYKFDGLLWRLLLMNKFKERRDIKFIDDRILMYREWFNMDIAKWIYHLGAYQYSCIPTNYYPNNGTTIVHHPYVHTDHNYVVPNNNNMVVTTINPSNISDNW